MSTPHQPTALNCPTCNSIMRVEFAADGTDKKAVCPACGTEIDLKDSFNRMRTKKVTKRGLFGSTTVEEIESTARSDFQNPTHQSPPPTPQFGGFQPGPTPRASVGGVDFSQIPRQQMVNVQPQSSGCGGLIVGLIVLVAVVIPAIAIFFITSNSTSSVGDFVENNLRSVQNAFAGAEVVNTSKPLAAKDTVNGAAISPDGTTLAAVSEDGVVTFWDMSTFQEKGTVPLNLINYYNDPIAYNPDGSQVVVLGNSQSLIIVDAQDFRIERQVETPRLTLRDFHFNRDGSEFVAITYDGLINVYDTSTWQVTRSHNAGGSTEIFAISGDGKWIVFVVDYNTIVALDYATLEILSSTRFDTYLDNSIAINYDHSKVAIADSDTVKIYDTSTWKVAKTLESDETVFSVRSLAFSPGGDYLAAGDFFEVQHIWEVASGDLKVKMNDVQQAEQVFFTPDGKSLISIGGTFSNIGAGSKGNLVRVWVNVLDKADYAPDKVPTAAPSPTPS